MRTTWIVVLCGCLVFTACRSEPALERAGNDQSVLRSISQPGSGWTVEKQGSPGHVFLYNIDVFEVLKETTILEVEPATIDSGLEFWQARASFQATERDLPEVAPPLANCFRSEQAAAATRFANSVPAAGSKVMPGEVVVLNMYVRTKELGRWVVQGGRITYGSDERSSTVTTDRFRLNLRILEPTRVTQECR